MAVLLGEIGKVELKRVSEDFSITGVVRPSDVNATKTASALFSQLVRWFQETALKSATRMGQILTSSLPQHGLTTRSTLMEFTYT